ncbi:transglycosylase domain-containing protein [Ruminococcus sp.]|uniref:transglycosylase domain-containing protein n=1 Tax=Ruminococcus sp. TaxID=41978 RepID=UPI0025DD691E|nr:transglycosylase domain-containing protein [Ruminococcus sp.]
MKGALPFTSAILTTMNDKNFPTSRHLEAADQEVYNPPQKKKKKKKRKILRVFKKLISVITATLLSLTLVIIITGTIVSTALTVYVLKFMDDSTTVTLQDLESGSNTYIYAEVKDENGNDQLEMVREFTVGMQRIPVSIDRIPQHVRDAFVYTEDERFYVHEGVDYKRTFSAFLNMFLHFYDTEQGGSTITQQLVKNLSGDDEHSPQRKIREIFSAMQLEKSYSKDEILEEYLNYIGFGGPINGIQTASLEYFGKSVDELSIPEAAVLAAIPKSPEEYGPQVEYHQDDNDLSSPIVVDGKANNKPRQEYVLYQMYDNGSISYDEYQEYMVAPLIFTDSDEYKALHPESELEDLKNKEEAYSWVLDNILLEARDWFAETYDLDEDTALEKIYKGGYKIYTKYDKKMQTYVEDRLSNVDNVLGEFLYPYQYNKTVDLKPFGNPDGVPEEYSAHVAFVAINYQGEVLCAVGNTGEKKGSLVTNYACKKDNGRQVGSTIKPIAGYGYAIESGKFHWGSAIKDSGVMIVDGEWWPKNYGGIQGGGGYVQLWDGLRQSKNTISAQLVHQLGPEEVYDFTTEKLGLRMDKVERGLESPLVLGALTHGTTLENLVNAYLPYGNQGMQYDAHFITKIEDSNQQVIYQNDGNPRRAVSDETAYVMNRLMKNVVGQGGTAPEAVLPNKVVVGKTGTTQDFADECFVGLTPDFASGITVGFEYISPYLELPNMVISAKTWRSVIGNYIIENYGDTAYDFEKVSSVIEAPMCSSTGKIAGSYCPKSSIIGYWKSQVTDNYSPPYCNGGHASQTTTQATTSAADATSGGSAGGNASGGAAAGGDAGGAAVGGDASGGAAAGGDAGGAAAGGGDAGGAAAGGDAGGAASGFAEY